VLLLLYRQTAKSRDENIGFDLTDVEEMERMKKKCG
jgi:hypothetical protein